MDRTLSGQPAVADQAVAAELRGQHVRTAATVRRLAAMARGGAAAAVATAGGLAGVGYYLVVTGKLTIDTGWGRRVRPLGPFGVEMAAPAATVFDVIAAPYLGRTPRAMSGKLQVLQRGSDMVLAGHYTPVHRGRLTAATLETVTFDRPHRIAFRLVRGPVPHITEEFALTEHDGRTRLDYSGELGTDFGIAGQWWAGRVAAAWEAAVRSSLTGIRTEAERRARPETADP
jgi:Polyketide cyclase / dehydrase and lipid transport